MKCPCKDLLKDTNSQSEKKNKIPKLQKKKFSVGRIFRVNMEQTFFGRVARSANWLIVWWMGGRIYGQGSKGSFVV